ncbi:MAG: TauD/TfdA family dioxygenase [Alphaproteobacteria bacterium]|nr:TauD/TfdA family dioxygenase [Alphaproteobacteria bacterium]
MSTQEFSSPRSEYTHIRVSPLTLNIGAEISGVDLGAPLAPEALAEVSAAFVDWKVIFFRGQNLDHAQHVSFARQMGEPTIGHAVFGHEDEFPEVYSIAKHRTANSIRGASMARAWTDWHTDITAAINPPMASILRGVTIPPFGGDTLWTNLAAAYRALSPALQSFVEGLNGIHRFEAPAEPDAKKDYAELIEKRRLESVHPLVTVHPVSGEKILYVSPAFLQEIEGLAPRESQALLEFLWEHSVRQDFTVRFKWQPGDLAMWDNRSTAHLAPSDIFQTDFDRQLYRITLVGETQRGTDGRASRAIAGLPILSAREELALAQSS